MFGTSHASLGNLPQWSRVGTLDKARYPRPLVRDQTLTVPPVTLEEPGATRTSRGARDMDPQIRVAILEKSIQFLQQQHAETLEKLHKEVDLLRRENKDLHYKLIMDPKICRSDSISGSNTTPSGSLKSRSGGTEQSEGQAWSRQTSTLHASAPEEEPTATEPEAQNQDGDPREQTHRRGKVVDTSQQTTPSLPVYPGAEYARILVTSLNPLQVCTNRCQAPRPPTQQECEAVIHQLYNSNHLLAQKLYHLKTCMRDLINNKWAPDVYLLARACLSDYPREREVTHFPKAPLKNQPKRVIEVPLPTAERVTLPALKQTLGNSFAERQKRTQVVQKSRLRRAVL